MSNVPKSYRIAADAMIIDDPNDLARVILITRKNPPFQGCFALPGGFLEPDETVEQCCIREAKEETCLDVEILRFVGVYSDPLRDPRGRTVTITYLCRSVAGEVHGNDDAVTATWYEIKNLKDMKFAFDHAMMLVDAGLLVK